MAVPLPALVWTDVTGSWVSPHPGILLAWRKTGTGHEERWEGWVISAWMGGSAAHGEKVYVHQSWTDAAHIRYADAPVPRPDLSRVRPANHGRSGFA